MRWIYYKLRQVLQSAMIITNCDSTRRAKNGDHLKTQNEGDDNNNTESTPHPRDYMSCFIKKKADKNTVFINYYSFYSIKILKSDKD